MKKLITIIALITVLSAASAQDIQNTDAEFYTMRLYLKAAPTEPVDVGLGYYVGPPHPMVIGNFLVVHFTWGGYWGINQFDVSTFTIYSTNQAEMMSDVILKGGIGG